ncbi:Cupredoxin [Eremomyces bilateralis CBS 781.70]|uniref:Cupredoxin n=1 Tax=Eremomyces bilateralis CBS 781.70 TaxID=1392243 RepID=A0A6G1G0U8_9PEZI|nr:Cupredoxin [Eremomyces bilateralis CBS 781.70]KAF1811735.1 Cupredoxin [Eremomyces bilateralis CBS 781.70]
MHFSTLLTSTLLLAGTALGRRTYFKRQQQSMMVHVVQAGGANGELTFSPNEIKANPGDLVQFQFWPKNHSVAQSNFANPCIPLQQSVQNTTSAFYSGFMPTTEQGKLVYTIPVTDTKPIWFYCSQGKHCQGGMVGAVNPPATGNTLAAFVEKAKAAPQNVSPGQASGGSTGQAGGAGSTGQSPSGTTNNPTQAGGPLQSTGAASTVDAPSRGFLGLALAGIGAFFLL